METIDPNQAARVWQRVRGNPDVTDTAALRQMIDREWEDAAIYLQLSRRCTGRESAALYQICRQEQAHCACLKGIYTLITGEKLKLNPLKPAQEPMEAALRSCYGRETQSIKRYAERADDPDYGYIFQRIRDQEQEHCRVLLELIGSWGKG